MCFINIHKSNQIFYLSLFKYIDPHKIYNHIY